MRKLLAVATLSAASVAGAVGVMGPAGAAEADGPYPQSIRTEAATSTGLIRYPTTGYTSPSPKSASVKLFERGDLGDAFCFTEGQSVKNNPYWIRVDGGSRNVYVTGDAIGVGERPHC